MTEQRKTFQGLDELIHFQKIEKKYRIVQGIDLEDIENAVNSLIHDGWIPLGSPQIVKGKNGIIYNQAMIYGSPIHVHQVLSDKDRDEIIAHAIANSTRMMQR